MEVGISVASDNAEKFQAQPSWMLAITSLYHPPFQLEVEEGFCSARL
jgi:hypothetical protein